MACWVMVRIGRGTAVRNKGGEDGFCFGYSRCGYGFGEVCLDACCDVVIEVAGFKLEIGGF